MSRELMDQVAEALEDNATKGSDDMDWREEMLGLAKCLRQGKGKKYSVHIRFADEIRAVNYGEAFDKMMAAFEDREGFEIMGHDIIEETEE